MECTNGEWPCEMSTYIASLEAEKAELEKRLRKAKTIQDRVDNREIWYWQGDGEDYPESLICPVVVDPETMRELVATKERLRKAEEALRNYANENLWDKNTSGFWVYSDRGPYEAKEALKGLKEKP